MQLLEELYKCADIGRGWKNKFKMASHLIGMSNHRKAKLVFETLSEGRRRTGSPRKKWI